MSVGTPGPSPKHVSPEPRRSPTLDSHVDAILSANRRGGSDSSASHSQKAKGSRGAKTSEKKSDGGKTKSLFTRPLPGHSGAELAPMTTQDAVALPEADGKSPTAYQYPIGLMAWYAAAGLPLEGRPGLELDEVIPKLQPGDVDWRHDDGTTPLMKAAKRGDATSVRKLIRHGAKLNLASTSGAKAINLILNLALTHHLDPKAIDWAAAGDHITVVQILLDHDAKTDTCGEFAAGRSRYGTQDPLASYP